MDKTDIIIISCIKALVCFTVDTVQRKLKLA